MSADAGRPFERRRVLDAEVDCAPAEAIVAHLIECASNRRGCFVAGISAPYAAAMREDAAVRAAFGATDVLVPDGQGFAWAARMLGAPVGERLAVPDLCERLLAEGAARGWKVFIYGATEAANAAACANVKRRFPGLAEIEGKHGYGDAAAIEAEVIARVNDGGFHLLLAAKPSPDKERFLARACREAPVVGVAAGGYVDVLAGLRSRAPVFVQRAGFEWCWRMVQDPRRLWKRIGVANVKFAARVLWTHLRQPAARPWWRCPAVHLAALALAVTAVYAGALNAAWQLDDERYIQDNPAIGLLHTLGEIQVTARRKLLWFSHAVCYQLSETFGTHRADSPDVRVFRAWNIACHLLAALALYGLLRRMLRARWGSEISSADALFPALAAALFAAHPLATEAVTYISGRGNSQGGMCYLCGLYFAAVAFERLGMGAMGGEAARARAWFWPAVLAAGFGAAAVLTKESHVTFPAAVALVYAVSYRQFKGAAKVTLSAGALLGVVCAAALLALGLLGRHEGWLGLVLAGAGACVASGWLAGERGSGFASRRVTFGWALVCFLATGLLVAPVALPYAYERLTAAFSGVRGEEPLRALATQANALPEMLLKALWPTGLNIDHDFPTLESFGERGAFRGALVLLAVMVAGVQAARARAMPGLGVLLALLSVLPTNTVIERGDVASERNFYLAAAGGAIIWAAAATWLAGVLARAAGRGGAEAALWAGVLGVMALGPFVSLTRLRNAQYETPLELWSAAVDEAPGKIRALYNLGQLAARERYRRYDLAEDCFRKIIDIGQAREKAGGFRPDETVDVHLYFLSYANRAEAQMIRQRLDPLSVAQPPTDPELSFREGLEKSGSHPDLAMLYGMLLLDRGQSLHAAQVLAGSLAGHPWAENLHGPLGLAFLGSRQFRRAKDALERALQIPQRHVLGMSYPKPPAQRADLLAALAQAEWGLDRKPEALARMKDALFADPAVAYRVLRSRRSAGGDAWQLLEETIDPDTAPLYLRKAREEAAELRFQKAKNEEAYRAKPLQNGAAKP